jgi:glycosyltransferase involved in cell wall biosynthesis
VYTFENPCLNADELPIFRKLGEAKDWNTPFTACFVGRMEDAKGVHRLVDLLMQPEIEKLIGTFHFVGDGPKLPDYERQVVASGVTVHFHGFLSRDETFAIYARSNLLMLPSDSEGFPKVVTEAAAFGCVPIVSKISSLEQYILPDLGFLWQMNESSFAHYVMSQDLTGMLLTKMTEVCYSLPFKFTFEAYLRKLNTQVFK